MDRVLHSRAAMVRRRVLAAMIVAGMALTWKCARFGMDLLGAVHACRVSGPVESENRAVKTIVVPCRSRNLERVARVLSVLKNKRGEVMRVDGESAVRITDLALDVDRLVQIAWQLDTIEGLGDSGIRDWILSVRSSATVEAEWITHLERVPTRGEITILKIIPDDRARKLIVVANDAGYVRVRADVGNRRDMPR